MSTRYEALLVLARRERELLDESRFEELDALGPEWEALAAGLPEPTHDDRVIIEEIELTVWSTVAALRLVLEETAQVLALLQRGRKAIGSYGGDGFGSALNARG